MNMKRQFKGRPVAVFFLLASIMVVVAFQNCGQLMPGSSAVSAQSSRERQYRKDIATVARVTNSSALNLWISSRESSITKTGSAISAVASINSGGFPVTPPLTPPTLATSSLGVPMFSMPGGSTLVTNSPNIFQSNAASFIMVVDAPFNGTLLRLSPNGYNEALTIEYASGTVRARHYFDDQNYESLSFIVGGTSGPLVIAASFGADLGALSLQINGHISTGDVINQGSPIAMSATGRALTVGDNAGTLKVGEVMAVIAQLQPWELNAMSRFIGDKWGVAVYNDTSLYPPDDGGGSDAMPDDVKQAIKTNCTTSCHTHDAWANYSVSKFTTTVTSYGAPLVTPGDYLNSELFVRMKATDGTPKGGKDKSMPADGNTVSQLDRDTIKNWIQSLH
jgi:hypothetical protein